MVCFRYRIVDTLHKVVKEEEDDDDAIFVIIIIVLIVAILKIVVFSVLKGLHRNVVCVYFELFKKTLLLIGQIWLMTLHVCSRIEFCITATFVFSLL